MLQFNGAEMSDGLWDVSYFHAAIEFKKKASKWISPQNWNYRRVELAEERLKVKNLNRRLSHRLTIKWFIVQFLESNFGMMPSNNVVNSLNCRLNFDSVKCVIACNWQQIIKCIREL